MSISSVLIWRYLKSKSTPSYYYIIRSYRYRLPFLIGFVGKEDNSYLETGLRSRNEDQYQRKIQLVTVHVGTSVMINKLDNQ